MEGTKEQKRPKLKSDQKFFAASSVASETSIYGDPAKTYANEEERKRAEIQSMMKTWKHYHSALSTLRSIYLKKSDDFRAMRECHQRIGEGYGEVYKLVLKSYLSALECCFSIPLNEFTDADRLAMGNIFSALIAAVNEMFKTWLASKKSIKKFLAFYLNNFEFLNKAQLTYVGLGGLEWRKLSAYAKEGSVSTDSASARIHIAIIKMFGEEAGLPTQASQSELEKLKSINVEQSSLLVLALEKNQSTLFREKIFAKREKESRAQGGSKSGSPVYRK